MQLEVFLTFTYIYIFIWSQSHLSECFHSLIKWFMYVSPSPSSLHLYFPADLKLYSFWVFKVSQVTITEQKGGGGRQRGGEQEI